WYDDTCDGPVSATVRIDGQPVPVAGIVEVGGQVAFARVAQQRQ
ncbi:LodA/GoxA family CTQ-dependent oxidase, partial [Paracidovorax avenae]